MNIGNVFKTIVIGLFILFQSSASFSEIIAVATGSESKDLFTAHLTFIDLETAAMIYDVTLPGDAAIPGSLFAYRDELYLTAWRHREKIRGSGSVLARFDVKTMSFDEVSIFDGMSIDFPYFDRQTGQMYFETVDREEALTLSLAERDQEITPFDAPVYLARLFPLTNNLFVIYEKSTVAFVENPFRYSNFKDVVNDEHIMKHLITYRLPMVRRAIDFDSTIVLEVIDVHGNQYLEFFDRSDLIRYHTVSLSQAHELIGKDRQSDSLLICHLPYAGKGDSTLTIQQYDLASRTMSTLASTIVNYENFGAITYTSMSESGRYILIAGTGHSDYMKTYPGYLAVYDREEERFETFEFMCGPVRKIVELNSEMEKKFTLSLGNE